MARIGYIQPPYLWYVSGKRMAIRAWRCVETMKLGLLRFIFGRLKAGDRQTVKDTVWLLFWVTFIVLVFRTHEPTIPPFEQLKVEEGKLDFVKRSGKIVSGAMPVINGRELGWDALWLGPSGFPYGKEAQRIITGKPARYGGMSSKPTCGKAIRSWRRWKWRG